MIYSKRLKRLFKHLGDKVDVVLISGDTQLLRFLTGCDEGNAIAKRDGIEIIVPRMFAEAAERTGMRVRVCNLSKDLRKILDGTRDLGLRFDEIRHSHFLKLKKMLRGFKFIGITQDVSDTFLQKDTEEIELIRKVCRYAAEAAKSVPSMLRGRMTEIDLMKEINYSMKAIGGGMVSFGINTSLPHHQPGNNRLKKGDFVMVDFYCNIGGVGSDITRTFCYGRASKKQKDIYAEVYRAQEMAFNMVKERRESADINNAVSEMFNRDGYGPLIHGIGHSIGYFNTGFRLVENQVVTVEPGIYIPGFGGVRIEDDVLITKDGFDNLTRYAPSKELIEV